MASLKISAFLSINQATVELRRFTVFIGPQAQGKSLALKLIHFFEGVINRALIEITTGQLTLAALNKESVERFKSYFPEYTWGTSAFEIVFTEGDFWVEISRNGGRKNSPAKIHFSPSLTAAIESAASEYKHRLSSWVGSATGRLLHRRNLLIEILGTVPAIQKYLPDPIFIPASRSFFANIERNIFTFISSKFELDLLMAEFGESLATVRREMMLDDLAGSPQRKRSPVRRSTWKHIIHGDYLFDGEQEYIESEERSVRISNASSGQQEAIPLLLMLDAARRNRARSRVSTGASFFVEEPEAHLFPKAQKAIASLMTQAMNRETANRVVFTTHSPYMLTAVNNLHLAGRLYETLPEAEHVPIKKIAALGETIGTDELAAYKVDAGSIVSIMDKKTSLVNGMLIDEVSAEFAADFERLLEISVSV